MWINNLIKLLKKNRTLITYNPHLFERKDYRKLDIDKIEYTARNGHIELKKCEKPNKLCLKHYFGKENLKYVVILRIYEEYAEVITAWKEKGK